MSLRLPLSAIEAFAKGLRKGGDSIVEKRAGKGRSHVRWRLSGTFLLCQKCLEQPNRRRRLEADASGF
jgi:hypothetical protein